MCGHVEGCRAIVHHGYGIAGVHQVSTNQFCLLFVVLGYQYVCGHGPMISLRSGW